MTCRAASAGALAAGDLTDSPGLELVAAGWNTQTVYVLEFEIDGDETVASMAEGWPRPVAHDTGIWAAPSLADVDGDHDLEIFVTETGSGACLMAWHHDGSEVVDGDNNPDTDGIFHADMGYWPRSTAAFGHANDVDDDPGKEIFVGTGKYHGFLKGLDGDGSELPGFPVSAHNPNDDEFSAILSSPAIGDVDGDGMIEIVYTAENDSLYMLGHDGSHHPGWPVSLKNDNWSLAPSVALADVTGDDLPEIFVVSTDTYEDAQVGWIDSTGQWMPGWPVEASFSTASSPVVGDIDGDGDYETLLGNEYADVEAWHHDGTPVLGFPLVVGNSIRSTPCLLDVNQDGDLDLLLAGWDKNVYIWTFPEAYERDQLPWYTFMHDQFRTGNLGTEDWVVPAQEPDADTPIPFELSANWPNPFNPSTQIRFKIDHEGSQRVRLSVLDVAGRHVTTLVDEILDPGTYLSTWDGLDVSGRRVASGVYFARLHVGDRIEARKMTLLK